MKFKNLNNFITKIPANYLAEMAKKNVAFVGNCKDFYTYFQKINKNCKYFSITKQNWKSVVKSLTQKDKNNMPKFDVIVGNPPYEGKGNPLYLQILEKVNVDSKCVIWICPTQWVKNYKNNNYLSNLKNNTCNNLIFHTFVGNPFDNATLANEVGIFVFGENDKYEQYNELKWERFKNAKLAKSICEKFEKSSDNLKNHVVTDNETSRPGFWVNNSRIRGNVRESSPCWDWTTLFGQEQKNNFKFDKHPRWNHWNFNSENECRNFIKYTETDICMFAYYITKLNNNCCPEYFELMPWLGDYTHEWTEEEIAKKLKLTKEEVEYIHQEMANFGWKAAPRIPKPETKDKMNVSTKSQTKVQKLEVVTKEQIKKLQIKGLNLVTQIKKKNVAKFGRAYGVEWRKINKKFSDNQTLRSYHYAKARIAVAKKFV